MCGVWMEWLRGERLSGESAEEVPVEDDDTDFGVVTGDVCSYIHNQTMT